MEKDYFSFDPGTNICRTPIPTRFEHLLKFITKVENFLGLHSQEDITNINNQLDQTLNLMVSNIIQRVISQTIGQTDKGFVTIKGTDDGELHVYAPGIGAIADDIVDAGAVGSLSAKLRRVTQALEDLKTNIVIQSGSVVQVEGTSQDEESAKINIEAADTHDIIGAVALKSHHITSIMFTVTDVVTVEFRDESPLLSGVMSFGDTNQPFGMTHNFGQIPLKCAVGKKFQIVTVGIGHVKGVITYYDA